MSEQNAGNDAPVETDEAVAFIRTLVNAWDCCGTCAGGVLAQRDRKRDARRDAARVIPPDSGASA